MKKSNIILTLILGFCIALSAQARDKRDFHETVYDSGCKTCHDQGINKLPSDDICQQCHDIDLLAKQTARQGHKEWQNPHNNMHYGKNVPCMECHGEHKPKEPLCAQCHNINFKKHKR
ncbi:cytochrome c3 family protein [uncultured Shewanella sp.]|uniref:cytochrome c3 family protein n=1 Tax=Shewanella atlantica TaxID=271099 RepID=UPI00262AF66A|nr:cytochrome c3 family protein [uncultured Shewanella sp.]